MCINAGSCCILVNSSIIIAIHKIMSDAQLRLLATVWRHAGADYGISYNSGNLSDSIYMNWVLTSALPLFPSTLFGIWYIDLPNVGRTKGNSSMFGACCLCIGIGAFFPAIATPMSTLGNFFANSVFNCVYISVPELYPTKYRGAVLAMSSASARFGSMAASCEINHCSRVLVVLFDCAVESYCPLYGATAFSINLPSLTLLTLSLPLLQICQTT